MNKSAVCLLAALLLAGCSHYTTTSKDIRFESTHLHIRTAIPVGDVEYGADEISYLGWVDAFVQKPSALQPDPTKDQVNYVLAHLAKERGADAVIHVTYKESIGVTGLTRLEARGQAIRIDKLHAEDPAKPAEFTSVRTQTLSAASDQKTLREQLADHTAQSINTSSRTEPVAPIAAPVATEDSVAYVGPDVPMFIEKAPTPIRTETDDLPVFNHLEEKKKQERPAPIGAQAPAKVTPESESFSYTASRRDRMTEQRERTDLMLTNARFLEKKALEHSDKDAMNAALRLIQMLEAQRRFFIEQEKAQ